IVLSSYLEKEIEYFKYKMVIYGNDEKLAKKVRALLPNYGNVMSIYTSQRDCKKLENQSLINVMTHEEFLKGKNKWYARAAACILYRSRAKKIISLSYTNRSRIYSLNREAYNYLEEVDRLKT